jgi:hypothetical protein
MITYEDLIKAADEITSAPADEDLEAFVGCSQDHLAAFLQSADSPMSEEQTDWFGAGLLVALRAIKNKENE